ncbi:MAG: sugar-binding protein [Verrucomicrobiae bacterium]|nr:sugar-binding protein [Verrucomicrobiae bacterium]
MHSGILSPKSHLGISAIAAALFMASMNSNGRTETLYHTSFESKGEVFGNFQPGNAEGQNGWAGRKAEITPNTALSGKQSLQLTPGNGTYGNAASKTFELHADILWVDVFVKPGAPVKNNYSAFLYLKGANKQSNRLSAVDLQFCGGAIEVYDGGFQKYERLAGWQPGAWHRLTLKVDFISHAFDFYLDGNLLKKGIAFRRDQGQEQPGTLSQIMLIGGSGASGELCCYDDLTISHECPFEAFGKTAAELEAFRAIHHRLLKDVNGGGESASDCVPMVKIGKTMRPPLIDGKIDEECWRNSVEMGPFLLLENKGMAREQTTVRAAYDSDHLYFAFRCKESVLDPAMNQTQFFMAKTKTHDSIELFKDDCVEIFIAPDEAKNEYYHVAVNANGCWYDASCNGNRQPDLSWNPNLHAGVFKEKDSWNVELAIPFKDLHAIPDPADHAKWKLQCCRHENPRKENSAWSPARHSFHDFARFGGLFFSPAALPGIQMARGMESTLEENFMFQTYAPKSGYPFLSLASLVRYGEKDTAIHAILLPGGNEADKAVATEFIFDQQSSSRAKGETQKRYIFFDSPDTPCIYQSPWFSVLDSTREKNAVKTTCGFISPDSLKFFPVRELHIFNGGAQMVWFQLFSRIPKNNQKDVVLTLELPQGLELASPQGRQGFPKPLAMAVEESTSASVGKITRYELRLSHRLVCSSVDDGIVLPLVIRADGFEKDTSSTAFFQTRINNVTEEKHPLNVQVRTAARIGRAKSLHSMLWPGMSLPPLSCLAQAELEPLMRGWHLAGFNEVVAPSHFKENQLYNRFDWKIVKTIQPFFGAPGGVPLHQFSFFNIDQACWNKNPEQFALLASGKRTATSVCPSVFLGQDSQLKNHISTYLKTLAQQYSHLVLDYEQSPFTLCFCDRCIGAFGREFHLDKQSLSASTILQQYKPQWVLFRNKQNAELFGFIKNIVAQANQNCMTSLYSGYQTESRDKYGVDWASVSQFADLAICGYGRSAEDVRSTLSALGKNHVPLVCGEAAWSEPLPYDFEGCKNKLFRHLTDGGGGFMCWMDWSADGRVLTAIASASSLLADCEPIFQSFCRADHLCEPAAGLEKNDVVVLEHDGERLIFVFNENNRPKTVTIRNSPLPPDATILDYGENTLLKNAPNVTFDMLANDVKIFYLGPSCKVENLRRARERSINSKTGGVSEPQTSAYLDSGQLALEENKNLALGKTYSVSKKPNNSYADLWGRKLTDGQASVIAHYMEKCWTGYDLNNQNPFIVIDLGKSEIISGISVQFLNQPQVGILFPQKVSFHISDDGKDFHPLGEASLNSKNIVSPPIQYRDATLLTAAGWFGLKDIHASGRHLKVTVESGKAEWIFISEVETH